MKHFIMIYLDYSECDRGKERCLQVKAEDLQGAFRIYWQNCDMEHHDLIGSCYAN